jgi:hypothetical protein
MRNLAVNMMQASELGTVPTSNNRQQQHRQSQWAQMKPWLITMNVFNTIIGMRKSTLKTRAPLTQWGEPWWSASEQQDSLANERIKGILSTLWVSQQYWSSWRKPPRKVSYKHTFGAPDQGQMLDMWESQTSESALRLRMCHITPRHTLEVVLEVILEHVLGIMTMTSLILDHAVIAYLYLGINIGEQVMILFIVIVLESSQDSPWLNKHALRSSLL